jgi:hypothetical protein
MTHNKHNKIFRARNGAGLDTLPATALKLTALKRPSPKATRGKQDHGDDAGTARIRTGTR